MQSKLHGAPEPPPEPDFGYQIVIEFDLVKVKKAKEALVHVSNVEHLDGRHKNYHLSGVDERIDISREQVSDRLENGGGAWALIKIEIPKHVFQNSKFSDTLSEGAVLDKQKNKYIFNISSYSNEDELVAPGVIDDLEVLLISKGIKFTFEYVFLSGGELRCDDQEGVSRDSVLYEDYFCNWGCGKVGSYEDVRKHEAVCSKAPPAPDPAPEPEPTPEPEDNRGLLSRFFKCLSKPAASAIMDNSIEVTGVSRNSTAMLPATPDSHKITKKRKKKTKKKNKTKKKKRKKKTKRYVKRNIK